MTTLNNQTDEDSEVPSIGSIIWQQINVMTKMSVGARSPMAYEKGLIFGVLSGNKTFIEVELEPSDTYKVSLIKMKKWDRVVLKSLDSVYVDNLNEVIYSIVNK